MGNFLVCIAELRYNRVEFGHVPSEPRKDGCFTYSNRELSQ